MKGTGWVVEEGGSVVDAGGTGATTLKWAERTTGIVTGTPKSKNHSRSYLVGGERLNAPGVMKRCHRAQFHRPQGRQHI
jgi:hypothetical protein